MKNEFAYTISFSNEGKNVNSFLKKLKKNINRKTDKVFCVVDAKTNHSTIKNLNNFCQNNKNFKILGYFKTKSFSETKLSALKACQNFKFIFDIDGNMAHDTNSIKKFKKKIFQYKYEAVCGSRFLKAGKYIYGSSYQRFLLSYYGTKVVNFILGLNFTDATGGYICISSKIVKSILKNKIYSKTHFYHAELKNIIHNFKFCEVPIVYKKSLSKIKYSTILLAIYNLFKLYMNKKI